MRLLIDRFYPKTVSRNQSSNERPLPLLSAFTKIKQLRQTLNKHLNRSLYITNERHETGQFIYTHQSLLTGNSMDFSLPALPMRGFYICAALLYVIWRRQLYFYVWFSIQKLSLLKVMWFTSTSWVLPKLPTPTSKHMLTSDPFIIKPMLYCKPSHNYYMLALQMPHTSILI